MSTQEGAVRLRTTPSVIYKNKTSNRDFSVYIQAVIGEQCAAYGTENKEHAAAFCL